MNEIARITATPINEIRESISQEQPPVIPMKEFFRNPQRISFRLSPDGSRLAFLQPWKHRLNIHVQDLRTDEVIRVTSSQERDITSYLWVNNTRLAYVQDTDGDENYRLYGVDPDGDNHDQLTPFEEVKVQLIDDLEDVEESMLIGMNKRDKRIFDAYRIDVHSGDLEMIAENPGNISRWMTDNDGQLRVAITTDGVNNTLLYRKEESGEFQEILTTDFKQTLHPLYFTFDNRHLYASSNLGRDKQAIVRYDPEAGEETEVLFEHPDVDVTGLLRSKEREVITGVTYQTEKRGYYFFDETRESLQTFLEKQLPGYEVSVTSRSRDERKILVRTHSDRSRGAYYFYDRDEEDFRKLEEVSPWLNEDDLCRTWPIRYQSRDGLSIPGYLTLPRDEPTSHLPVVVNPHGGPWARDYWGFNPEVQFLANRGYAVLQVNYRGSTGFGRSFWEKGFKEWGKAMQNDISDGVHWLIDEGIADPDRIGIYGGSYGGYATLAGLTFTPDLYTCGVDYVGVSNLFTFMDSIPPYWEQYRETLYEMVGHPEEEAELLKSASPLFHADQIQAPLLIAQGANDPRVKKAESDQIVEALRERGIDVPYMVKDDEGHGFRNEENRFDFYRAMEEFLAKHLNGHSSQ